LEYVFGVYPLGPHLVLCRIDVEGSRGQMVDVRSAKAHHVGDQSVCMVQLVVRVRLDNGVAVPTEGFQNGRHEGGRRPRVEASVAFETVDERDGSLIEDVALGQ
jgi:hypothetical protein